MFLTKPVKTTENGYESVISHNQTHLAKESLLRERYHQEKKLNETKINLLESERKALKQQLKLVVEKCKLQFDSFHEENTLLKAQNDDFKHQNRILLQKLILLEKAQTESSSSSSHFHLNLSIPFESLPKDFTIDHSDSLKNHIYKLLSIHPFQFPVSINPLAPAEELITPHKSHGTQNNNNSIIPDLSLLLSAETTKNNISPYQIPEAIFSTFQNNHPELASTTELMPATAKPTTQKREEIWEPETEGEADTPGMDLKMKALVQRIEEKSPVKGGAKKRNSFSSESDKSSSSKNSTTTNTDVLKDKKNNLEQHQSLIPVSNSNNSKKWTKKMRKLVDSSTETDSLYSPSILSQELTNQSKLFEEEKTQIINSFQTQITSLQLTLHNSENSYSTTMNSFEEKLTQNQQKFELLENEKSLLSVELKEIEKKYLLLGNNNKELTQELTQSLSQLESFQHERSSLNIELFQVKDKYSLLLKEKESQELELQELIETVAANSKLAVSLEEKGIATDPIPVEESPKLQEYESLITTLTQEKVQFNEFHTLEVNSLHAELSELKEKYSYLMIESLNKDILLKEAIQAILDNQNNANNTDTINCNAEESDVDDKKVSVGGEESKAELTLTVKTEPEVKSELPVSSSEPTDDSIDLSPVLPLVTVQEKEQFENQIVSLTTELEQMKEKYLLLNEENQSKELQLQELLMGIENSKNSSSSMEDKEIETEPMEVVVVNDDSPKFADYESVITQLTQEKLELSEKHTEEFEKLQSELEDTKEKYSYLMIESLNKDILLKETLQSILDNQNENNNSNKEKEISQSVETQTMPELEPAEIISVTNEPEEVVPASIETAVFEPLVPASVAMEFSLQDKEQLENQIVSLNDQMKQVKIRFKNHAKKLKESIKLLEKERDSLNQEILLLENNNNSNERLLMLREEIISQMNVLAQQKKEDEEDKLANNIDGNEEDEEEEEDSKNSLTLVPLQVIQQQHQQQLLQQQQQSPKKEETKKEMVDCSTETTEELLVDSNTNSSSNNNNNTSLVLHQPSERSSLCSTVLTDEQTNLPSSTGDVQATDSSSLIIYQEQIQHLQTEINALQEKMKERSTKAVHKIKHLMADVASKKSILEKQTLELRNFESSLNIAKLENSSLKKEIIKLTNEIQFISSNYEQQVENLKVANERKDIQIKKLTLILDHAPVENVSAMITNNSDVVKEKKMLLLEEQQKPEVLESVDKAITVKPVENEEELTLEKPAEQVIAAATEAMKRFEEEKLQLIQANEEYHFLCEEFQQSFFSIHENLQKTLFSINNENKSLVVYSKDGSTATKSGNGYKNGVQFYNNHISSISHELFNKIRNLYDENEKKTDLIDKLEKRYDEALEIIKDLQKIIQKQGQHSHHHSSQPSSQSSRFISRSQSIDISKESSESQIYNPYKGGAVPSTSDDQLAPTESSGNNGEVAAAPNDASMLFMYYH
jgi:hypothetical protein